MRTAAIIPARGGSERLPRKNLARVGALTLVEHAIASAAACDEAWVSTDDDEIAAVAARAGARVVMRPAHLATGTASTESAVQHWWRSLRSGERPDAIAIVQPATLVVRDAAEHLRAGLRVLETSGRCGVVAVTDFSRHAPFEGRLRPSEDGAPDWLPFLPPDGERPRTQDARPVAFENGAWWLCTADHWRATGRRSGPGAKGYRFGEGDVVDIDTAADLALARLLWSAAVAGGA